MRLVLRGVVLGLVVLALAGALAGRFDLATISAPRAEGPGPWLVSRISGLIAFVALACDVILGMLVTTRLGARVLAKPVVVELHRWLSPLALALVLAHALLLLADGFIHFDVLDLLVPFISPYRPVAVGIGIVALYVAVVVHASFAFRKRIGPRWWRRLHYLSFAALAGAALHGILAGSDTGSAFVQGLYATVLAVVIALVTYRFIRPVIAFAVHAGRAERAGPVE